MEMAQSMHPPCGEQAARRDLFSVNGQWMAFVTADNSVWTPTGTLVGRVVRDDIFDQNGVYIGTINGERMEFLDDRRLAREPSIEPASPTIFPGYPGVPSPTLIRPMHEVSRLV